MYIFYPTPLTDDKLQQLTTKFSTGVYHMFQSLTINQLVLGLFLYSTLIVLGTIFFAITLEKLDNIYFFELYSKLFLRIQNNIDLQLTIFYNNSSKKTILKFFINDVPKISVGDYNYISYVFNVKLNLPLPAIESMPELYINYFFVNTYILFLFILLFLLYWFFCGRTFTPTVLKSTYILSHKRTSQNKHFLYKNFTRGMHSVCSSSAGNSGDISNFITVYNSVIKDLQSDSALLNFVLWVCKVIKLDINDNINIFYIKKIISMFGKVSPYDTVVTMSKLIASRGGMDFTNVSFELKGVQSRIGLLTDALKIKPEILYTSAGQTGSGKVVKLTETLTSIQSPKINHSTLAPRLHSINKSMVSSVPSDQLLVESTGVLSKNDLFFYLFKILIVSGICIGVYFIYKNLLVSDLVETNSVDTISSDFVLDGLVLNYHIFYFTVLVLLLLILINICISRFLLKINRYSMYFIFLFLLYFIYLFKFTTVYAADDFSDILILSDLDDNSGIDFNDPNLTVEQQQAWSNQVLEEITYYRPTHHVVNDPQVRQFPQSGS